MEGKTTCMGFEVKIQEQPHKLLIILIRKQGNSAENWWRVSGGEGSNSNVGFQFQLKITFCGQMHIYLMRSFDSQDISQKKTGLRSSFPSCPQGSTHMVWSQRRQRLCLGLWGMDLSPNHTRVHEVPYWLPARESANSIFQCLPACSLIF